MQFLQSGASVSAKSNAELIVGTIDHEEIDRVLDMRCERDGFKIKIFLFTQIFIVKQGG